ncbi:MAG: 2Fe-2S iron-sulfur cluster-binding protein [Desulfobacterales bacterium]
MATVQFNLNGKSVTFAGDVERMLLWILRTDLALTGAKYGCGEGLCGACTVLVNGEAVLSCQTPVKDVGGAELITIEGLSRKGSLHPIQQANKTRLLCLLPSTPFREKPPAAWTRGKKRPVKRAIQETFVCPVCAMLQFCAPRPMMPF